MTYHPANAVSPDRHLRQQQRPPHRLLQRPIHSNIFPFQRPDRPLTQRHKPRIHPIPDNATDRTSHQRIQCDRLSRRPQHQQNPLHEALSISNHSPIE
jgi:hypothetical protein